MEITSTGRLPINVPSVAFVDAKVAISAIALVVLLVGAPLIYSANSAVREFQRETLFEHLLFEKQVSRIRGNHRAMIAEANELESPDARRIFLVNELERANIELAGSKMHCEASHASVRHWNTIFRRITGNKNLQMANQLLYEDKVLIDLANRNVEQVAQAIRALPKNAQ